MSEEDKKIFSGIVAFILTAAVAFVWFFFHPIQLSFSAPILPADQVNSFEQSFQESMNQFNAMKAEIYGTTTATSTDMASTSIATSTMSTTTTSL